MLTRLLEPMFHTKTSCMKLSTQIETSEQNMFISVSHLVRDRCHRCNYTIFCCCCLCKSMIVELRGRAVSVTSWVRWLVSHRQALYLQIPLSIYKSCGQPQSMSLMPMQTCSCCTFLGFVAHKLCFGPEPCSWQAGGVFISQLVETIVPCSTIESATQRASIDLPMCFFFCPILKSCRVRRIRNQ